MVNQTPNSNTPRKVPRQSRSMVTVNAILDATAHIFVTNGYAKTNTNIIAEHAGVSIGSLYQYFPNKNALIKALYHRHVDRMQAVILQAMKAPIDIKDKKCLFSLIETIVRAHLLEPELHLKFEEIENLEGWISTDLSDLAGIQAGVVEIISVLPQLTQDEKHLKAFMLTHAIHALVHTIAFKRPFNTPLNNMIMETVVIIERYLQLT